MDVFTEKKLLIDVNKTVLFTNYTLTDSVPLPPRSQIQSQLKHVQEKKSFKHLPHPSVNFMSCFSRNNGKILNLHPQPHPTQKYGLSTRAFMP